MAMEPRSTYRLQGNSGCVLLYLHSSKGEPIVRKISPDPAYNLRLQQQFSKLQNLPSTKDVSVVGVLDSGFEGECFYYDMPFMNGINFADYVNRAAHRDVIRVFSCIVRWITLNQESGFGDGSFDVFLSKKIIQLSDFCNAETRDLLTRLQSHKGFLSVMPSICHGDLAFDNMIIDVNGHVTLIDPMVSYAETYLLDVSKLFFDLFGFWSELRYGKGINPGLYRAMRELVLESPISAGKESVLYALAGVDLLRVLQYVDIDLASNVESVAQALLQKACRMMECEQQ